MGRLTLLTPHAVIGRSADGCLPQSIGTLTDACRDEGRCFLIAASGAEVPTSSTTADNHAA